MREWKVNDTSKETKKSVVLMFKGGLKIGEVSSGLISDVDQFLGILVF